MKVNIRELRTQQSRIEGINCEYRHWAPGVQVNYVPYYLKNHRMWGAFVNGELVGMIRINTDPLKAWQGDSNYDLVKRLNPEVAISGITVEVAYRNQGIGRRLRTHIQRRFPGGIITGTDSERSYMPAMNRLNRSMGFVCFWQANNNAQYYWGPNTEAAKRYES